jgi:hypothetical protein
METMTRHPSAALWIAAAMFCGDSALAQDKMPADDESAKDIVADTVRSQGYPCDQPKRATRDEAASLPDQAAWVLECANAKYWVRYDNDEPAEIRQVE